MCPLDLWYKSTFSCSKQVLFLVQIIVIYFSVRHRVSLFCFTYCSFLSLTGHGAEVKCIDWHPQKGLIVSGSKDSQQPVKLWDPRSNNPLATLHAHKSTVMAVKFNQNGSWLLTASRDHVCKLFDIRTMKELYTFRGHKKEATGLLLILFNKDILI